MTRACACRSRSRLISSWQVCLGSLFRADPIRSDVTRRGLRPAAGEVPMDWSSTDWKAASRSSPTWPGRSPRRRRRTSCGSTSTTRSARRTTHPATTPSSAGSTGTRICAWISRAAAVRRRRQYLRVPLFLPERPAPAASPGRTGQVARARGLFRPEGSPPVPLRQRYLRADRGAVPPGMIRQVVPVPLPFPGAPVRLRVRLGAATPSRVARRTRSSGPRSDQGPGRSRARGERPEADRVPLRLRRPDDRVRRPTRPRHEFRPPHRSPGGGFAGARDARDTARSPGRVRWSRRFPMSSL